MAFQRKKIILLLFVFFNLAFFGCEAESESTPEQFKRDKIIETEGLLPNNVWNLYDFKVRVKYKSQAIPVFLSVADENDVVFPVICDSYGIFRNANCQLNCIFKFLRDNIEITIYKRQAIPQDNATQMFVDLMLISDFSKNIDKTILKTVLEKKYINYTFSLDVILTKLNYYLDSY